jgi:hypothetical protein
MSIIAAQWYVNEKKRHTCNPNPDLCLNDKIFTKITIGKKSKNTVFDVH